MKGILIDRVVFLSSIGFAIGVIVGVLITAVLTTFSINDGTLYLCVPEFTAFIGDQLMAFMIQVFLSGLLGLICMGTSAMYEIEEWSLLKATLIHYIISMTVYYFTAFFLKWLSPRDIKYNLIIFAALSVVYTFIWLSHYISYKVQITKINRELTAWKAAR